MRQFSSGIPTVEESKFNEGIKFVTGDKVKIMVTKIKPSKSEEQDVNAVTEIGGDWTEHANFKDGMLFICTAIAVQRGKEWIDIVDCNDIENIKLPFGKYGYQFYHTVNFTNMFGKNGQWPLKVSAKQKKGESIVNAIYPVPASPFDWEDWTPAERFDYWCSFGALMLNCGKEAPYVVESSNGWTLDQSTIHRLAVGDVCTAIILKQTSKTDPDKHYTYLKTMVKNTDPNAKYKYTAKNNYDLIIPDNSIMLANAIYEAINKQDDPGEKTGKSVLDSLIEDDAEDVTTEEGLPF